MKVFVASRPANPLRPGLWFGALIASLTLGCPDPTAGLQEAGGNVPPGGSGPGGGGPGGMGAPDPGATQPNSARFSVKPGEGVAVSGNFTYEGPKTGVARLDFLQSENNQPPKLIHTVELKGLGPWSVNAPKETGEVWIVAFIDQKSDGPSADDPAARTTEPITIGTEPINGVDLKLVDDADLGDFTPGRQVGPGVPAAGAGGPGQPGDGQGSSAGVPGDGAGNGPGGSPPPDGAPGPDGAQGPDGAPGEGSEEGAAPPGAPADGAQ